jgi:NADPH:quinone reductase-like Zn-dependent oxidoreductase
VVDADSARQTSGRRPVWDVTTPAAYHFVFTRQSPGKLDALTTLVERGLLKPVIGATLPLARMGEAHALLENRRSYALRGKVAIDVAGETVELPPRIS